MNTVILGGGSAGTSVAFFLRKLDKEMNITIIEKTKNLEYSPCAMPYVVSGEIAPREKIFLFDEGYYLDNRITVRRNTSALSIERQQKRVVLSDGCSIQYDKLIIATGSYPIVPGIKGIEHAIPFRSIADMDELIKKMGHSSRIAIIGAGLVGTELAYALSMTGKKVVIVENKERVLSGMLDSRMSEMVQKDMLERGVEINKGVSISEILPGRLECGKTILYDTLLYCTGFKANDALAVDAGLSTNNGIIVDDFLKTSDPDIYACGDCALTKNIVTGMSEPCMLGSNAVRQAKAIARGITGDDGCFNGHVNATITRLGNIYVGSVGITEEKVLLLGMRPISAIYSGKVRSEYYPSDECITCFLLSDADGRILGGQIVSGSNVSGWISTLSLAITSRMTVKELSLLETCYNPASASINDPLVSAAEIILSKIAAYSK